MAAFTPILMFDFQTEHSEEEDRMIRRALERPGLGPERCAESDRADLYQTLVKTIRSLAGSDSIPSCFPALLRVNAFFAGRNIEILGIETIQKNTEAVSSLRVFYRELD